jgi:predicted PurR-regulated permease PerM
VQSILGFLKTKIAGEEARFDLADALMKASGQVLDVTRTRLIPIVTGTGVLLMNFAVMLFVMFYAFRDGGKMLAYLLEMMPLSASHEATVIARIRSIARAILLGSFLTAATQGAAGMIGFQIVGIPALFWGVMLGIASLVPIIGTGLIWVPASVYLYIIGKTGAAVFLFIWGAVVVGSIDNFLRPFFMKGQSGMSTIVLFFAILGGIRLFGPIGIVYGPLIFGMCAVILYIYRIENLETLQQLERQ